MNMESETSTVCVANDPCCPGMCEWTDCSIPQERKLRLTTSSSPRPSTSSPQPLLLPSDRFQFKSDKELTELSKGYTPANTSRSTKWALNVFDQWCQARNQRYPEDTVPEHLLTSCDPLLLNTHLARFAVEARKTTGESYPPATVHQLLCGLLRYMRENVPGCPNFLDKKDSRFRPLQGTLDALFHQLHSDGVGVQTKHTEILTKEDEEKLWSSGVMGVTTPRSLQNAAFFIVGKMFSLRGGVEHRKLKLSQLKRNCDPDHYVYYENVSKTNSGSFRKLRIKGKVVPVYACPEVGERCPVFILDTYLSKLPPKAHECDLFYLRPLSEAPTDASAPWYAAVPVGKDTLQSKLNNMCKQAGIGGNKTNHSLRAASATQMYDSGVPEKLIQERTGHRSLEALRMYERTNAQQHQAISAVLSAPHSESTLYHQASEKRTLSHTLSEVQSTQHAPSSFNFQNLHGCTININAAPSQPVPTTSVTDHMEIDIDKIIASITEDFH